MRGPPAALPEAAVETAPATADVGMVNTVEFFRVGGFDVVERIT